jgi:phosphoglycolate phosphatase
LPHIHVLQKSYETALVIFDKDGTLLDFKQTWLSIIGDLLKAIDVYQPMTDTLRKRIEDALGIHVEKGEIDGYGLLAMGTFSECNAVLTYCLYMEGQRWDRAQHIVDAVGKEVFSSVKREQNVRAAPGAITLLKTLKSRGILTAVATNDKRSDALIDMDFIGAAPYIDLVVGADSVENAKPAPDMVDLICREFGKSSKESVLVGDTIMDALLGKNSGVMLTIGVTGIVPKEVLKQHVDVVISSLEDIT